MRRLVLVLALALAAGACSGGDEEIAGVGDTVIHLSDLSVLYEGDTLPLDDSLREALFRLVAVEALTQALAVDFGVTVAPEAVEERFAELEANRTLAGATPAQFLGIANASVEMVRFNAEVLALRDAALQALLEEPSFVDSLFADPEALAKPCVSHILVGSQEEAEAVKERLEAGEDLAAVAEEVSLDTQTEGGDLGCRSAQGYVPEFARAVLEAPLGEVYGPVETQYGFHVLVVRERTIPTREEYLADPQGVLSEIRVSEVWTKWFNEVLRATEAWVAERFGTWTPTFIRPPGSDTTTTGG